MGDRRPERIEALRRRLASEHLDGLLVSSLPNIRYLTGFSGTSALVLVTQGTVLFLSDFRYRAQAAEEIGSAGGVRIHIEEGGLWERMFRLLGELAGVRDVAYEAHVLTAQVAARLENPGAGRAPPWKFVPHSELIESQREVKSPEEIAAVREAGACAAAALHDTVRAVRAGQRETEVAGILESALRRHGSEAYPFATIVASGPRTALPHARTSSRVLAPGDLLLLDFGAVVGGYCSDVTRTFVMRGERARGREGESRQAEVYEIVREAQARALAGIRAGLTGRQADALARDPIAAAGYGEAFGHSLGHGLGLEVHEAPRLAKTVDQVLPEGAVVTVEPGIYLEGWGGVRIEDDVALSADGAELLTEFPRELITLG